MSAGVERPAGSDVPPQRSRWFPATLVRRRAGKKESAEAGADFPAQRDELTAAALPLLAGAVSLMLLLGSFFRLHPGGTVPGAVGTGAVGVTGLGLLVAAAVLSRRGTIDDNAHQVATVILVVAALGLSVSMIANGSLAQTVYYELLLVCAGAVLLRRGWLVTCLAALWMLWLGVAALLSGTTDPSGYLLAMVGATIIAAVINRMRTESLRALGGALEAAEAEAVRDELTGLLNRRGMTEVGRELMAVARRNREAMSCTFIDVDGLKEVNDRFGHEAGDELIVSVAESLTSVFREADVVVRWGGDEFVVLSLGPGPRVEEVERRLMDRLDQTDAARASRWQPSVSAGRVVQMPWQDDQLETVLERADAEMYRRRRLRRAKIGDEDR